MLALQDGLQALKGFLRRAGAYRRGLSAHLLVLTVAAVMTAALLILLPSAAAFRTQWLTDKVEAARLASLAALSEDDLMVSDELARRLLEGAQAVAVAIKRDGMREVILPGETQIAPPITIDLRSTNLWTALADTCFTFTSRPGRMLLIVNDLEVAEGDFIEVLVEEAPLKEALWAFSKRVFGVALLVSALVGGVIYAALAVMFVRPMRRLAHAMTSFQEEPEDPTRVIRASGRADEIGEAEAALAALQEQVRQALGQKAHLAALGSAVAKINHDLRNVLTSAQLVSDRLAQNPDEKIRAQGERLVRAIDRGVRLAEEVLKYGRAEERPPAREPIVLRPLLEEAFTDAAAAADAPTGLDLDVADDVRVTGDAEHLHRVFLNLMRNAVIAIAGQSGRAAPGMIRVRSHLDDGFLAIDVADDGPGVPARAQAALFQPFAAGTSRNGSGLGLSIARELARAHGGDVTLLSTGETGTVFEVRLPREG